MENANNKAIGMRLEQMYHTAVSIHDIASQLIGNDQSESDSGLLWAIKDLARGQARELETMAEHFQEDGIGYYEERFGNEDAALILSRIKQGVSA